MAAPLLARLAKLLNALPIHCILCGRLTQQACGLCSDCVAHLPRIEHACPGCGSPLAAGVRLLTVCGGCLSSPNHFDFCRGLFHYQAPVDRLITRFKFQARLEAGVVLARLLSAEMAAFYNGGWRPQMLLPMPLHPRRYRQRGFNQARELARVAAAECGIPLRNHLAIRHRHTSPQTEQASVAARRVNIGHAFRVADTDALEDVTHITIIDDVVTTMATVNALSRCLKSHGVRRVDVWCVARASR